MEIRRFGPGYRRPDGPPGTQGLTGLAIWNDENATIAELAFTRRGFIAPHTNPNTTLFIVISGGGVVRVGDEQVPINHGEAVVWPPDVLHGAYTDGVEMRAIVVELKGVGVADVPVIEGNAEQFGGATERTASPATAPPWETGAATATGPSAAGAEPAAGPSREASGQSAQPIPAVEPARGGLAERRVTRSDYDATEGEPW